MFFHKFNNAYERSAMWRLQKSFELHIQIGYLSIYFAKQNRWEQIFNLSAFARIFQKGAM